MYLSVHVDRNITPTKHSACRNQIETWSHHNLSPCLILTQTRKETPKNQKTLLSFADMAGVWCDMIQELLIMQLFTIITLVLYNQME